MGELTHALTSAWIFEKYIVFVALSGKLNVTCLLFFVIVKRVKYVVSGSLQEF